MIYLPKEVRMKVCGRLSDFEWKNVSADDQGQSVSHGKIKEHLSSRLAAENLVVLFGAGASKAIKVDKENSAIEAPLVRDILKAIEAEDKNFNEIKKLVGAEASTDLEEILSRCILYYKVTNDEKIEDFISTAKKLIVRMTNFLGDRTDLSVFESFLRLISSRNSSNRSHVFTLNYDLALETAASNTGFTLIDGFSFSYPHQFSPIYFDYDLVVKRKNVSKPVEAAAYFYKLHGSLNWTKKQERLQKQFGVADNPMLIFPTKDKFQLSYEQPFLEMVTRLKEALRLPQTTLLLVGYSCGDEHINSILSNSLDINFDLNLILADPWIEKNDKAQFLRKRSEINDQRLTFLEIKFEELMKTIPHIQNASREEIFLKSLLKVAENA
ncbi:SIR2 family protein [Bdellovibrio sp. HCB290]|uniref:SIR2 family protein n=1 Tax=Bdellovibrio sp. HCB290 TaxID=3394356 RepID=UPI0039B554F4